MLDKIDKFFRILICIPAILYLLFWYYVIIDIPKRLNHGRIPDWSRKLDKMLYFGFLK